MSFAPALLAKLTLILAAGLLAAALLRSAAPSLRHLVLIATLACGLTLPVAMALSPQWKVPVLPQTAPATSPVAPSTAPVVPPNGAIRRDDALPAVTPSGAGHAGPAVISTESSSFGNLLGQKDELLLLLWAVGIVLVISWLAIGRIRLRRIAREAWPLKDGEWRKILGESCAEAGVKREVRLLSSSVVSTPLTWGSISPVILLPDDAIDWSEDHRRVVLRHELAHIARKDSLAQLGAGFVCALYWFHPLVWMSERRLRGECERACDDRVVSLGTPAPEYASHLLEVARSARAFGAPGFLSVAMARPSQLEGRLLAVLNGSRRRIGVSRPAKIAAAALSLLVLLPLAAFRPVPKSITSEGLQASIKRPAVVPQQGFDTTFVLSAPARSGGRLELELKTGANVTITSWDRPQVSVRASLRGRSWRQTRVKLEPSDGDVTLTSDFVGSSTNASTGHHFDIQVPRTFDVHIKSSGGSVSIADVSGRFTGTTGGGEITIRNANGSASIQTGGGEILVTDSNLDGRVSTGGGLVRIQRVNGNLKATSGSGPVIYTESRDPKYDAGTGIGVGKGAGASIGAIDGSASASASSGVSATTATTASGATTTTYVDDGAGKDYGYARGSIRMTSAGGDLRLPAAPDGARVITGGGRITIGPSGGELYAQTGGGPIHIGPATGSVAAHTGAGDVDIELKGSGPHNVDVTSGKGEIVIVVPSDINATLELETAYTNNFGGKTRIVSDWPLSITETSDWDDSHGTPRRYVRAHQNIGRGGGVIRVRTTNGDVVLKRSGR